MIYQIIKVESFKMKSIKQFWRECIEDLGDEHQNYLKEQKGDSGL